MAFSRYRSSGRRTFGSRFRRRRFSYKTVRRPVKWERGNFYVSATHLHEDPDRTINTVFVLAQINNLIDGSNNDTFASTSRLAQMAKALIIGGVKFTVYQNITTSASLLNMTQAEVASFAGSLQTSAESKVLLTSDRTVPDVSAGPGGGSFPAAIEANFFTNTLPTASIAELQDEQTNYPTRIHWQNYKHLDAGWRYAWEEQTDGPSDVPFLSQQNSIVSTHSTGNLRLRLRLQDDEALCWFFTSHLNSVPAGFDAIPEVHFLATGTIWYRYDI